MKNDVKKLPYNRIFVRNQLLGDELVFIKDYEGLNIISEVATFDNFADLIMRTSSDITNIDVTLMMESNKLDISKMKKINNKIIADVTSVMNYFAKALLIEKMEEVENKKSTSYKFINMQYEKNKIQNFADKIKYALKLKNFYKTNNDISNNI